MIAQWSIVVVAALVSGCKPATPAPATDTEPAASAGKAADSPADAYYFDGKLFRLERSTSEWVVGVDPNADPAAVMSGALPGRAAAPMTIRGRTFVVVALEDASEASNLSQRIGSIRARPDVWFVSPIYYQPASRARVVPTDELVVRVKASTTPEQLERLLTAKGLRQVARLDGTTDQYILRIESAKNEDVLRVSRELYETGLFDWAEPDFVQEIKREG